MKIKLSDYVWDFINKKGVKDVFMFPGGGAMHLVDSLGKSKINNITLLHEQACAMAAETYSRITYTMGTALVTTGPGGTNTLTGVAAAWMESTPMIVISGQVKTDDLKDKYGVRQLGTQEIGIVNIVKTITKYAVMITNPNSIKYHLEKAFYEANTGRPGPVWIDIPLDIQASIIDTDNLEDFEYPPDKSKTNELREEVYQVIHCIKNAKKPLIIAGQGIDRNKGKSIFRNIVQLLNIPVLTSWMATELLPYNYVCNLGKPGMVAPRYSNWAMQNSDLVIAIGTRLDPAMIGYNPEDFAPLADKIIIDIDKNELNKFKFPVKLKIESDATEFLKIMYDYLHKDKSLIADKQEWLIKCLDYKKKYPVLLPEFKQGNDYVNPYYFFDHLSDFLADDDVIIPGSSGTTLDIFWLSLKNKEGQRCFSTGALGSMGYGIPAAMGACIGSHRRTICVEGDGSFQLNIQELADIKGLNLPIKIFVLDNGGYLSIMNTQKTHFNGHFVGANYQSGLYIPDIIKIAQAYGFDVFEIKNHQDMDEIIKKTINNNGPAICRVVLANDIIVQPKVMSRVMPDGKMVSGSLSHLWPFIDE